MPSYQGQTDEVLVIRLPSEILSIRFLQNEIAANGEIGMEVLTRYVGEGAPIRLRLIDGEGEEIIQVTGCVLSNIFRGRILLDGSNTTGWMRLEAEMPKHKLTAQSVRIKVMPQVLISKVKFQTQDGQDCINIIGGEIVKLTGSIKYAPLKSAAISTLWLATNSHEKVKILSVDSEIDSETVMSHWQAHYPWDEMRTKTHAHLHKTGETYHTPAFILQVECLGVSGFSDPVNFVSWKDLDFKTHRGLATVLMPDGSQKEIEIPSDGILDLPQPNAGSIRITHFVPKDEKGTILKNRMEASDESDLDSLPANTVAAPE